MRLSLLSCGRGGIAGHRSSEGLASSGDVFLVWQVWGASRQSLAGVAGLRAFRSLGGVAFLGVLRAPLEACQVWVRVLGPLGRGGFWRRVLRPVEA